jgi:predicted ferric reductase
MRGGFGIEMAEAIILSRTSRIFRALICIVSVLTLLAGAASVPFVFESRSILYKLGADKTLLRTGQVMGMIAATLLLFQLLLSSRLKFLDHIFALNRLYLFHRVNAVVIAVLAGLHPLFVFAPEDITSIPVELKYWPEVLGALMLVFICFITASGIWRLFLAFKFHRWWLFHRITGFAVVVMLVFHLLYVSETFESGLPRFIVVLAGGVSALLFGWVKVKPALLKKKPYSVVNVTKTGQDTYAVEVTPRTGKVFQYIPGQFAFVSFRSENISSEEHPFTISSTPSRSGSLQFLIRCSGDWTARAGLLAPGDTAYIDGAYGHFSHLFRNNFEEYIMIAGGIGITPMLSMLRYMADNDETRRVTLIWSNRTNKDLVFADEFVELERRLHGLKIIYVFTRQSDSTETGGRLNQDSLDGLLIGCRRDVPVFVCGPLKMMDDVQRWIVNIGFSQGLILTEDFSL